MPLKPPPGKNLKASDRKAESRRIAVLGWGSLLRRPRELSIRGDWQSDGPWLPVEFARISKGGHLTLVIVPRRKSVRTYWALSGYATLKDATHILATREGTGVADIGYLTLDGDQSARFKSFHLADGSAMSSPLLSRILLHASARYGTLRVCPPEHVHD